MAKSRERTHRGVGSEDVDDENHMFREVVSEAGRGGEARAGARIVGCEGSLMPEYGSGWHGDDRFF